MALETASFISQLNPSNPAATDLVNQADDHMRLIKAVLQGQFPGFTAVALASSNTQLDNAVKAVVSGTATITVAAGSLSTCALAPIGDSNTGVYFPSADEVDLVTGGVARLKVQSDGTVRCTGNLTVDGAANITGGIGGVIGVPIGGSLDWWTDTLPSSNWSWLNGGEVARSNATLFSLWGTTYGVGNGSTTFNVPDTRERTTLGKSTMGATSSPGRITQYTTNALNSAFGENLHTMTVGELVTHTHTVNITDTHTHTIPMQNAGAINMGATPSGNYVQPSGSTATSTTASGSITAAAVNQGSSTPFNVVQPSIICNKIVRIN